MNFITSYDGFEWRGAVKQSNRARATERETENRTRERAVQFLQSQRGSNKKNGQPHQNITSLLYSEITF